MKASTKVSSIQPFDFLLGSLTQLEAGDTTTDLWEAPDSEASDTEDEFDWLWQRGDRLVHDHWPSERRSRLAAMVDTYITKAVSSIIRAT
jgi:hypothetical protein